MNRMAYLGPAGTFSEEAALRYNKSANYELIPMPTIYDVINGVDTGIVDTGIVPIENSVEGVVSTTLDVLVRSQNIYITEELDIEIIHNLLAKPGTTLSEITDVYSHYQPIGQCVNFLREKLPHAKIHGMNSTAEAAIFVSGNQEEGKQLASIGTINAAGIYGLDIIAGNINDYPETITRFVVLGHHQAEKSGTDKTSLAFTTHADKPGGLYEILGVFANRGINLTKIESRPSKGSLGQYIFFIDLQGHITDPRVEESLEEMGALVQMLKILGSYPIKK